MKSWSRVSVVFSMEGYAKDGSIFLRLSKMQVRSSVLVARLLVTVWVPAVGWQSKCLYLPQTWCVSERICGIH